MSNPARLIGLIAETLAETMGNEKAVDQVPGRSDQQLSERGSEGRSRVNVRRGYSPRPSTKSITQVSHSVKRKGNSCS